jgi:prephenate dehydrogenase
LTVGIIGLGLIGGSLGLALRKKGTEVLGYARTMEKGDVALRRGAVDKLGKSISSLAQDSEVVIIATPIHAVKEVFEELAKLSSLPIITDTASTKVEVTNWAREYFSQATVFIGGHPMSGKETWGVEFAQEDLFNGCTYCLTPHKDTPKEAIDKMADLAGKVGAHPLFLDAEEHDKLVAGISHLPMLLSCVLMLTTAGSQDWPRMSRLTSSGFRDLTRLASQSPELTSDILKTNRENVSLWASRFMERLGKLCKSPDSGLEEEISKANAYRQNWLNDTSNKGLFQSARGDLSSWG